MSNYWFFSDSQNTLSKNILSDQQILDFLLRIPRARRDFQEAFDLLTSDDDKTRIFNLIESNSYVKTKMLRNERDIEDAIQKKHNTAGIFIFRG
jgi:hypothetical protein